MAVAFRSKYTARDVEKLLDSINTLVNNTGEVNIQAIERVEALPDKGELNRFYLTAGKIYYWDNEWFELTNTPAAQISIPEIEGEVAKSFNFSDFIPFDDIYLTYNGEIIADIKEALTSSENKEMTIYPITNLTGKGWIEDSKLENDIFSAEAAQLSESNFFIFMHLMDGQEVKITEHYIEGETVYLINYIGLAL